MLWSVMQDDQLVRWTFSLAASKSREATDLTSADLVLDTKSELTYACLKDVAIDDVRTRFATLKVFNLQLARCMDMIDMNNTEQRWSLSYHLRNLGHLIFAATKQRLIDVAVDRTWMPAGSFGVSIVLDNQAAFVSLEKGHVDPATSQCMFMQAFQKVGAVKGKQFRARVRIVWVRACICVSVGLVCGCCCCMCAVW